MTDHALAVSDRSNSVRAMSLVQFGSATKDTRWGGPLRGTSGVAAVRAWGAAGARPTSREAIAADHPTTRCGGWHPSAAEPGSDVWSGDRDGRLSSVRGGLHTSGYFGDGRSGSKGC